MTLIKKEKPKKIVFTSRQLMEHICWCFKNDYIINVKVGSTWTTVILEVNNKGVKTILPNEYKQVKLRPKDEKWGEVIQKMYTEYYLKNNKNYELQS